MAAVRGHELHQLLHCFHVGAVAQKTTFAFLRDQAAGLQFFQVKGQQVRGNVQRLRNLARTQAVRTCAYQKTEYPQARNLGEGGQHPDSACFPGKVQAAVHAAPLFVPDKPSGSFRVISQQMNNISAEPSSVQIRPPH